MCLKSSDLLWLACLFREKIWPKLRLCGELAEWFSVWPSLTDHLNSCWSCIDGLTDSVLAIDLLESEVPDFCHFVVASLCWMKRVRKIFWDN